MGVGSFLWGAVSDRLGARIVVLGGGVSLGLGLAASSQAATLTEFQLVFGISVGLAAGSFYVPLTALTTRWFTRHRSLAVALVSAGPGLGTTIISPLARRVILHHDWRYALLVLAAIAWAVIVPAALLPRKAPDAPRTAAAAVGGPAMEMTVAQALRRPQFAAIALANFLCCAAHSGPIFHMVTYAVDCGVPDMAATTVFGVAGLSALSGRIVRGLIADRAGARRTLIAALFGLSYGGAMPLYAILVREYFPAGIMGSVFGVVAMVSTLGMALATPNNYRVGLRSYPRHPRPPT
jgi:MFS family permease